MFVMGPPPANIFCALISSITICASSVAVVSRLLRLLEAIAANNSVVIAPRPVANTSMATSNSRRVLPLWQRHEIRCCWATGIQASRQIEFQAFPPKYHFRIRPAGLIVMASISNVTEFWKKAQKAVAPPALSHTAPPAANWGVHGRPRGPKVMGVPLPGPPSLTASPEPAGRNCALRLAVAGAFPAVIGTTSAERVICGSRVSITVPPLPEAPVLLLGYMSTKPRPPRVYAE